MDIFEEEIWNFWRNLEQSKVDYIMIGSYAKSISNRNPIGLQNY